MSSRARQRLAVLLAVAGGLVGVLAGGGVYAREELASPERFADRALAAYDEPPVRRVVARQVTTGLIDRGSTDLVSFRPLIEQAVEAVAGSAPLRAGFRAAVLRAHRLLFEEGEDRVVVTLADVGTIAVSALRSVAPDVARRIPEQTDTVLVDLRERPFAQRTVAAADDLRRLAVVLVALAVLLTAGGVALARDRRAALAALGMSAAVTAIVGAVALAAAKGGLLARVEGTDVLPAGDVRAAVDAAWDAFLGDLSQLLLLGAGLGLVLAAAARTAGGRLPQLRSLRAPRWALAPTASSRALRGTILVLAGLGFVLAPSTALLLVAYAMGAALLYAGLAELLGLLGRPRGASERELRRQVGVLAGVALVAVVAASVAASLVLDDPGDAVAPAAAANGACNGSRALCARRIDEITWAGTHNAMSAADTPGWLLTNQRRDVARQLRDGIDLLLIDAHYGRRDPGGRVVTDVRAEGRERNKVVRTLSPEALRALERIDGGAGGGGRLPPGRSEVFWCHTLCELGATSSPDVLGAIRAHLDAQPGAVVSVIVETYVQEDDLAAAFREAGLADRAAVLDRSEPLPTLGELVRSGKRLIVMTEAPATGEHPWIASAFSFVQDTDYRTPDEQSFSCARNRGSASSPILMLNHWIDRFPPPLSRNREILRRSFLEARVERCQRERRMRPAFLAVDFYDQAPFVETVDALNDGP